MRPIFLFSPILNKLYILYLDFLVDVSTNMKNQKFIEHNKEVYYATEKIIKLGKSDIQLIKNMINITGMEIEVIFILNCGYLW